jgi:hypothetical protein
MCDLSHIVIFEIEMSVRSPCPSMGLRRQATPPRVYHFRSRGRTLASMLLSGPGTGPLSRKQAASNVSCCALIPASAR